MPMQPKKLPTLKHIAENSSEEDATASSTHKSSSRVKGIKPAAEKPEIIVYLPSCKSIACDFELDEDFFELPMTLRMHFTLSDLMPPRIFQN